MTPSLDLQVRQSRITSPDAATIRAWRAEEPELVKNWQEHGCERSLVTLLQRYNGYIRSQVFKIISGRSLSESYRNDLMQEAQLAFVKALSSFDSRIGTALSTHVMNHVRPALLQYALEFRNGYRIGAGSDERKAFYAALSLRARKIQKGKSDILDEDDIAEIRKTTGSSEKSTRRAVSALYTSRTDIHDGPDLPSPDKSDDRISDLSITRAMDTLSPFIAGLDARQRAILESYMSDDNVPSQVLADRFSITQERIGQIRREMLANMADFLKKQGISADDLF